MHHLISFGRRLVCGPARVALLIYWPLLALSTHWPDLGGLPRLYHFYNDKVAHFCGFLVLTLLGMAAAPRRVGRLSIRVLLVMAMVLLYAAFDEVTQLSVRGRIASVADWCADLAGVTVGALLFLAWNWVAPLRIVAPRKSCSTP